jgi:hypothetical protein
MSDLLHDHETCALLVSFLIVLTMSLCILGLFLFYRDRRVEKPLGVLVGLYGTILGSIGTFYFQERRVHATQTMAQDQIEGLQKSTKGDAQKEALESIELQEEADQKIANLTHDYWELFSELEEALDQVDKLSPRPEG